jgi:hypothetical protein
MDQGFAPQHNCDAMSTGLAPASACDQVAGLGVSGVVIIIVMVLVLGLIGFLLWRRMRNREEEP